MKCPKCQHENPSDARFCNGCGQKLELACPECGKTNPPGSKFCNWCGDNLALLTKPTRRELSFDEKLKKIQKYLPTGITEKILAQRDKIEGERKQVTVMFCDMEGFTPLSEKLGPEEMYRLMDQVYEILIHKVHDYDGTVNEMTGDGIMALFGAPIALEDAPQRAIRSALAMHREITKFSDQLKSEKNIPALRMRIGIHTGPVVVGTLGNDLRVEFKAVGDTVNLASRMEGLAEPGTTYVTEDIFKLTEGFFRFESLGERRVKGKEQHVKVYQVIAPSTRRTRFDVSAERGLTPFVGRERELELLLDGFERVKAGKGQAFSIVSEAGCGKSRLLYEFRKAIANEDVNFLEGKCLSYGKAIAYHPHIDILKSSFDIQEGEGDQQIREKVTNGLKALGADEVTTLPYLLEILSVKDSGIDQVFMSPEEKRDRIGEAIKRIVIKGSESQPLVIAIEDLHWMDKGSEDVVKTVLGSLAGSRVLLILTYRPEFVPNWGAKSYQNQLTLHRLSNRESLEMVRNVLVTKEIERALGNLVFEKTEGVPFFIEEFVRSFKDLKIIEEKGSAYQLSKEVERVMIPSTIQDVIMARVDSLPERAKEVLQTGSVIEREFTYELIKCIMGSPEQELLFNLSVLKDSELLYERGICPQSSYIFKHALIREVIYDSILANRKKRLHEEIANVIEELYRNNLSGHFEVLSEHYFLSENYSKGSHYSRSAVKKAEKAASFNDAIAYAKKRVVCLERLPRTEDIERQLIDARTTLGLDYAQMLHLTEAREAIVPIIDLALRHDYKRRLCQIYTLLGSYYYFVEDNYPEAFKALEQALKMAEEVTDIITSILASFWYACALGFNCEFEKSEKYFQRAIDINVAANNLVGVGIMKSNLAYFSYFCNGKIDLAFKTSKEGLRFAEDSGDIYSKVMAYASHGVSCYGKGLLEESNRYLLKTLEFSERINFAGWDSLAESFLSLSHYEMGDFEKSKEHYEKAALTLERNRLYPSWVGWMKIGTARSKVMNGEKDLDLESLYLYSRNNKAKAAEGWIQKHIGEILLNIDDHHISEAEYWIQKAIEADLGNHMMFLLGNDYALYADLLKRKGNQSAAQENLGKSIETFKECGADGWVVKYEEQMAKLK